MSGAEQLDLLNPPDLQDTPVPGTVIRMARTEDPSTSHAAANAVQRPMGRIRAAVLRVHQVNRAGLTDAEMVARLPDDVLASSATKRRTDLVADGILRDSGKRRPTPSGCLAIVWELVPDGARVDGGDAS